MPAAGIEMSDDNINDIKEKSTSTKFYAVANGHKPGIYDNWNLAEKQVYRYSGQCFKGFSTLAKAEEFMLAKSKINPPAYYIKDDSILNLNSTMNSFSLPDSPTTTKSTDANSCSNCSKLEKVISQLTDRICKVENQLPPRNNTLPSSTCTKLEELEAKITSLTFQLTGIRKHIKLMPMFAPRKTNTRIITLTHNHLHSNIR